MNADKGYCMKHLWVYIALALLLNLAQAQEKGSHFKNDLVPRFKVRAIVPTITVKVQKLGGSVTDNSNIPVEIECDNGTETAVAVEQFHSTTNEKGIAEFRFKVVQKSNCRVLVNGKKIRDLYFEDWEGVDVREVVIQHVVSKYRYTPPTTKTEVRISLFKKNKRLRKSHYIQLACVDASGNETFMPVQRTNPVNASVVFSKVPPAQNCLIYVGQKKSELKPVGDVDFHNYYNGSNYLDLVDLDVEINGKGKGKGGKGGKFRFPRLNEKRNSNPPVIADDGETTPEEVTEEVEESAEEVEEIQDAEEPLQNEVLPEFKINLANLYDKDNDLKNKSIAIQFPGGTEKKIVTSDENGNITINYAELPELQLLISYVDHLGNTHFSALDLAQHDNQNNQNNQNISIKSNFEFDLIDYNFDTDKHDFKKEDAASYQKVIEQLTKLAEVLAQFPTIKIVIHGHTDIQAEAKYNLALSQRRATTIKNYLVQQLQVDESRIRVAPHGEEQTICQDATPECDAKNRRIEVRLE